MLLYYSFGLQEVRISVINITQLLASYSHSSNTVYAIYMGVVQNILHCSGQSSMTCQLNCHWPRNGIETVTIMLGRVQLPQLLLTLNPPLLALTIMFRIWALISAHCRPHFVLHFFQCVSAFVALMSCIFFPKRALRYRPSVSWHLNTN